MLMDSLAVYGLTPSVLQVLIVAGVALVIVGFYWHYILAGGAVLFSIYILFTANAAVIERNLPDSPVVAVNPIQHVLPIETEKQRWYRQFMEDCTTIAENSKETCENIWNDRMMDESHLEVNPDAELSNASYKVKRNKL
jgi:hypothetical protein